MGNKIFGIEKMTVDHTMIEAIIDHQLHEDAIELIYKLRFNFVLFNTIVDTTKVK